VTGHAPMKYKTLSRLLLLLFAGYIPVGLAAGYLSLHLYRTFTLALVVAVVWLLVYLVVAGLWLSYRCRACQTRFLGRAVFSGVCPKCRRPAV
jgi:hypothetical protein